MMKKILLPLWILTATSSLIAAPSETGESKKKEVKEKTVIKKEKKKGTLVAQIVSITLSEIVVLLIAGAVSGWKRNGLQGGFCDEYKISNTVIWATIACFGCFYVYLLVERWLSGSAPSFLRKIFSAIGSLLIVGLFDGFCFLMYLKNISNIKDIAQKIDIGDYLGGVLCSLITALLPWLIYKGIKRFILKGEQKTTENKEPKEKNKEDKKAA